MFQLTIICANAEELQAAVAKLTKSPGASGISLDEAKALNAKQTKPTDSEPEQQELFEASKKDVKRILTQYKEEFGSKKLKALFTAFGAKNMNHLEPDEYDSIYAAAELELEQELDEDEKPADKKVKKNAKSDPIDREALKTRIQKIARKDGASTTADFFEPAPFTSVRGIKNAAESVLEAIEDLVNEYEEG